MSLPEKGKNVALYYVDFEIIIEEIIESILSSDNFNFSPILFSNDGTISSTIIYLPSFERQFSSKKPQ